MVVYLPLAFVKDWIYSYWKRRYPSKHTTSIEIVTIKGNIGSPRSPLKANGVFKGSDPDLQSLLSKTENPLSFEGRRTAKIDDSIKFLDSSIEPTSWEIAKKSFSIAPLWLLTEVCDTYLVIKSYKASRFLTCCQLPRFFVGRRYYGDMLANNSLQVVVEA